MSADKSSGPGATAPAAGEPKRRRSESAKWVLQTLAMPIALVALPLLYQWKAGEMSRVAAAENQRREAAEQQFRLYTDLMSKREEADTAVRRGLFDKLVGSYLDPRPGDPGRRLVALELLSLNFHDSLNLSPLFWDLDREINSEATSRSRGRELRAQLDRIARQLKTRQAAMLEIDGWRGSWDLDLAFVSPGQAPQSRSFTAERNVADDGAAAAAGAPPPKFTVTVLQHDPEHRRLFIKIDGSAQEHPLSFWLDPYDFPLTNFSRVSRTERIAVMINEYHWDGDEGTASIVLLYFPSSRSGAKDRPYIDDLIARLGRQPAAAAASSAATAAAASSTASTAASSAPSAPK